MPDETDEHDEASMRPFETIRVHERWSVTAPLPIILREDVRKAHPLFNAVRPIEVKIDARGHVHIDYPELVDRLSPDIPPAANDA